MLCSALDLAPQEQSVLSSQEDGAQTSALEIAAQNGFQLAPGDTVTRGSLAELLYQASLFSAN